MWRGGPDFERSILQPGCRTDLEGATGLKPEVGFNWHNGRFEQVTVTFPRLYAGKPLGELAGTVREVVAKEFKQTPDTIVLAFSLSK
jgi:hypothetical protein